MTLGFAFEGERMKVDKEAIRRLNDELRKGLSKEGQIVATSGVSQLGAVALAKISNLICDFDAFTPDNDPHGEHDFGSIQYGGNQIFWKIDLYEEPNVKRPNEAPVATRVLTIMLASEY